MVPCLVACSEETDGGDPALDDDLKSIMDAAEVEPDEETSFDKIAAALEASRIDQKRAAVLTAWAAFTPGELPAEYQGAALKVGHPPVNGPLQWAVDSWQTLDPDTRSALEPFILPPDDPKSFFNPANASSKASDVSSSEFAQSGGCAWKKVAFDLPGKPNMVQISYCHLSGLEESNAKLARWASKTRDAVARAWPMFKTLLGVEPTDPFTIKFGDVEKYENQKDKGANSDGVFLFRNGRCEITLNEGMMPKDPETDPATKTQEMERYVQAIAAHELFHCFQNYIPLRFSPDRETNWLLEATATWAEDFVYRDHNAERVHLKHFFPRLDKKRVQYDGKTEYASYMWFFFLSQTIGADKHVRDVLFKTKSHDARTSMVETVAGYPAAYAEFALYDWNRKPWIAYQDKPSFPTGEGYHPSGSSLKLVDYTQGGGDTKLAETMAPGGICYHVYVFGSDHEKIPHVEFNFDKDSRADTLGRQALVKIGDVWHLEDWSTVTSRRFCRRKERQRVRGVVIVYSNGAQTAEEKIAYEVKTGGDCGDPVGYTLITETATGPLKQLDVSYRSEDEIRYDEGEDGYVIVKRRMRYHSTEVSKISLPGLGECTDTVTGEGVLEETYKVGVDAPYRFALNEDAKGVDFVLDPEKKNPKWVTYSHNMSCAGGHADSWTEKGDALCFLSGALFLESSMIKMDSIEGEKKIDSPGFESRVRVRYDLFN